MNRNDSGFLWAIALCAAMACNASESSNGKDYRAGMNGYGPVRVGMTVRQVEHAIGRKLVIPPEYENEVCQYVDLGGGDGLEGTDAMLWSGRVVRLDFRSNGIKTISGLAIGDPVEKIKTIYRDRVTKEPHAYIAPDGFYYTIYSSNRKYGVRFETDQDLVTGFYAGRSDAIELVEGCL